jgi:hypothetical protein
MQKKQTNLRRKTMIISDLAYLEVVTEEVFGGSGVKASKRVNLNTKVNQVFKVNIDIDAKKDIKSDIDSKVDVKGYAAITVFDNTAIGPNTYVESNVSNIAKVGLSESSGSLFAAVSK